MSHPTQGATSPNSTTLHSTKPRRLRLPGFKAAEQPGTFIAQRPLTEQQIIEAAQRLLGARHAKGAELNSTSLVREYLRILLGGKEQEVFAVVFLDYRHRIIETREMFQGSISGASVYPREIVKTALALNAAAVILAHNHPSGINKPSSPDKQLTCRLQQALGLVEVRVLDHFIVGHGKPYSFSEHGLI